MTAVARLWFPAAVALLVGVIALNLATIYYAQVATVVPPERPPVEQTVRPEALPRTGGGVRVLELSVVSEKPRPRVDPDPIHETVRDAPAIHRTAYAYENPQSMSLTLAEPLTLNEARRLLARHGLALVEGRTRLRGDVSLYLSGNFCCEQTLKTQLAGLEGVEVASASSCGPNHCYVRLHVADSSRVSLADLRETLDSTRARLENLWWLVGGSEEFYVLQDVPSH